MGIVEGVQILAGGGIVRGVHHSVCLALFVSGLE